MRPTIVEAKQYKQVTFETLPIGSFFIWNCNNLNGPQSTSDQGFACGVKINESQWVSLNDSWTTDVKGNSLRHKVFVMRLADVKLEPVYV